MAKAASMITGVKVEFIEFPAVETPPSSTKSYFLGGAGISLFYYNNVFTARKIKFRKSSI